MPKEVPIENAIPKDVQFLVASTINLLKNYGFKLSHFTSTNID